ATRVAEAVHRRRSEDEHPGLGDLTLEPLAELGRDRLRAQLRLPALVERAQADECRAEVRADGVEDERPARVANAVIDAGCFQGDLLDFRHHRSRALQRGRVRQLYVDDQAALILAGDETRGNPTEAETRQAE